MVSKIKIIHFIDDDQTGKGLSFQKQKHRITMMIYEVKKNMNNTR